MSKEFFPLFSLKLNFQSITVDGANVKSFQVAQLVRGHPSALLVISSNISSAFFPYIKPSIVKLFCYFHNCLLL
jgi:hypothetical protein